MMKRAKIICKDTNVYPDHKCEDGLIFFFNKEKVEDSVSSAKSKIQEHYFSFISSDEDKKKLMEISDDLIIKMLKSWAESGNLEVLDN